MLESKEILDYSDLLPNISLVVGQLSVNILLALRARDISIHDLPPASDIFGNKSL